MKKLVGVVGTLILLMGVFSACGKASTSTSDPANVTIKIGTDASYAPFEYIDAGTMVGFDVDLLKEVMKTAGLKYDLQNTGWDPLFASLGSKQVDMGVSAITITSEREQKYDFSSPYYESRNMILVKEGSSVKSAEDLKNLKKIGVQNGTTGQEAVEKMLGKENAKIAKYDSNVLAIMALKNGEVDAVVCDNGVAKAYVKNNPNDKIIAIDDTKNFTSEYYGFIFIKNSPYKDKFNEALQTVINNGKYREIYKKWFNEEPNLGNLKK